MKSNPLSATITALTIGATLIIQYWQPVKTFFVNFWTWITDKLKAVGDFFDKIGSSVGGFFKKLWPFGKIPFDNKEEKFEESVSQKSLQNLQISTPANRSAVNSNNKTLTNNMTFNITGTPDSQNIADEINKVIQESSRDALYDSNFYGG